MHVHAAPPNTSGSYASKAKISEELKVNDEMEEKFEWYKDVLRVALIDRNLSPEEEALLQKVRLKLQLTEEQHGDVLEQMGWDLEEYEELRREEGPGDIDKECVVCLDKTANFLITNCFHLCLCSDCISMFQPGKDNCPECREPIAAIRQTFY